MPGEQAHQLIGGQVGEAAVVQQGQYLNNIVVQPKNADDAIRVLRFVEKKWDRVQRPGLPRRLEPDVLLNRYEQLKEIERFFEDAATSVLYVFGMVGIGKAALVRGVLELRRPNVPVVWVNCEKLDMERLLREMNAAFKLELEPLLRDPDTPKDAKIEAVLGAVETNSICVLHGFEALLDVGGHYQSSGIAAAVKALTTLEHRVKAIFTTRQLPHGVGQGTPGVQILSLSGLPYLQAKELFLKITKLTQEEFHTSSLEQAFEKLEGHPLFIQLLASAVAELPPYEVAAGLLTATDIGDYIMDRILGTIDVGEMQVLRGALLFRNAFPLEALSAVYGAIGDDPQTVATSVRSLVRRALLEVVSESQAPEYYLHRLLREAVPRDAKDEATAHRAASSWFLREPIEPADPATWDDGLYHLRRCAEVGDEQTYFESYSNFLIENDQKLSFAGWGRRLVDEYRVLDCLAKNELDRLATRYRLADNLWALGEISEATNFFHEISEAMTKYEHEFQKEDAVEFAKIVARVRMKLADSLVKQGKFEEASRLADEVEALVEETDNLEIKTYYQGLRFLIARKSTRDPDKMLPWAIKNFDSAKEYLKASPSDDAKDALAEAHFNLGITYLYLNEFGKMTENLVAQLRIKLEIGKISGVAAGLHNLGIIFSVVFPDEPALAGAVWLTSEQIELEVGIVPVDRAEHDEGIIQQFLTNSKSIDQGRESLGKISDELLPYFERGLERRSAK